MKPRLQLICFIKYYMIEFTDFNFLKIFYNNIIFVYYIKHKYIYKSKMGRRLYVYNVVHLLIILRYFSGHYNYKLKRKCWRECNT